MTWISINPKLEREEVVETAMALSGWYQYGWSEDGETLDYPPDPDELSPIELAGLYNNSDRLGLDIYTVSHYRKDENEDWGLYDDDENRPGIG
jgi:hypothetical protein